jgi:hypothetical protein
VIAVVLGGLVVVALPWWRPADPYTGRQGLLSYAPSSLVPAIAALPPGAHVVTPQTWASFLEWSAPDALYFLDSRFELFPARVWADYATLVGGSAAAQADVVDTWGVDAVVVPTGFARPEGAWRAVVTTVDGTVYVRQP